MLTCSHCGQPFAVDDVECETCGKNLVDHGWLDNPRRTIGVWIFSVYLIGSGVTSIFLVPYFALLEAASGSPEFAQFGGLFSRELAIGLIVGGVTELVGGMLLFSMKKAAIPFMIIALIAGVAAAFPIVTRVMATGPMASISVASLFSVAVQIAGIIYARRLAAAGILGWKPAVARSKGLSWQ